MPAQPPPIDGARRSFVDARGVRFHVAEAGAPDGRPVLALHGWPQHHWVYRDLLADPPPGMRIIAPDLPGYGWSGPPPHRWAKDDVASDVLALMDVLELERVLLVGHDWGGFVGYRMVLRGPERIEGYLVMNMAHPWLSPRVVAPHLGRFWYQALIATVGVAVHQRTRLIERVIESVSTVDRDTIRVYTERFRDPVVARTARDTYRTFLLREVPAAVRAPAPPRTAVPIRCLFGLHDNAVPVEFAAPETARADDYTLETADASHFIVDERPDLVRARLLALADETQR